MFVLNTYFRTSLKKKSLEIMLANFFCYLKYSYFKNTLNVFLKSNKRIININWTRIRIHPLQSPALLSKVTKQPSYYLINIHWPSPRHSRIRNLKDPSSREIQNRYHSAQMLASWIELWMCLFKLKMTRLDPGSVLLFNRIRHRMLLLIIVQGTIFM